MGGYALEIGKMAMYMTFPVAMFYWFNRPEYFEKWVSYEILSASFFQISQISDVTGHRYEKRTLSTRKQGPP
jgi:Pet100